MRVFYNLKENLPKSSCLALGFFDGVHPGHQKVILDALKKAEKYNTTSTVVTFSEHPRSVLSKSRPEMISSLEERLNLFESLNVQSVVVLDFDENFAKMTAKEYLENILIKNLNPKSITIGYNHKFGGDKAGNDKFLKEYGRKYGFEISIVSPVKKDNHVISSSVIRKFILNGDVVSAENFLGRAFKIKGKVVHGKHLGRELGFPTANLDLPDELIIPKTGVYEGLAKIDSKVYDSVINVGKRPTVDNLEKDLVEVHILDFNRDIYGKILEVSFSKRIRREKKFNSREELKIQIKKDCEVIREYGNLQK